MTLMIKKRFKQSYGKGLCLFIEKGLQGFKNKREIQEATQT